MKANEREDGLVLTVAQAAKLLQMSENTVYSLCNQALIPHIRFGKLIRIPKWGLLQYIARSSGTPLPTSLELDVLPIQSVDGPHDDGEEE